MSRTLRAVILQGDDKEEAVLYEILRAADLFGIADLIKVLQHNPMVAASIKEKQLKKIDDLEKDLAAAKKAAGVE